MSRRINPNIDQDIETAWNTWWKEILVKEDGSIDVEQLKKELYDFSEMIDNMSRLACLVSGGKMSYSTYSAEDMFGVLQEQLQEEYDQGYKDAEDDLEDLND